MLTLILCILMPNLMSRSLLLHLTHIILSLTGVIEAEYSEKPRQGKESRRE